MTLNEDDLAYFRESTKPHMYRFLLPLLRCDDITWNESTRQILLSGELFATRGFEGVLPSGRITLANKFWRNNTVISIDDDLFCLKINTHKHATVWHNDNYYQYFINESSHRKKRHVSKVQENLHMVNFYLSLLIVQ